MIWLTYLLCYLPRLRWYWWLAFGLLAVVALGELGQAMEYAP